MTKKSSRKIKSVVASLLAKRSNAKGNNAKRSNAKGNNTKRNNTKRNNKKGKKEMANAIDDYLKCGDKHCNKIVTRDEIGKLQSLYFAQAAKECKDIKKKSEKKKCWNKINKKSEFTKKMTERKKCVKKHCSKKQKTLNKNLKVMKFEF